MNILANKLISLFRDSKRYSGAAVLVFLLFILVVPQSAHAGVVSFFTEMGIDTLAVLITTVFSVLQQIFALILAMVAAAFDAALSFSLGNTFTMNSAVSQGWTTTRDVTNLFFIFIMLAISIATILRIEQYGAKALMARLIIVALLLNFSMPLTKVIIDSSNILALVFYSPLTTQKTSDGKSISLSGVISNKFNIAKTIDQPTDKTIATTKLNNDYAAAEKACWANAEIAFRSNYGNKVATDCVATVAAAKIIEESNLNVIYGENPTLNNRLVAIAQNQFFGVVYTIIVTFILLALMVLFIIRGIVLGLLIVISPMAFLFMVLPRTQSYASQWWGALFNQAFFAPVSLFFLYLSLSFTPSFGPSLLTYIYMITILLASIIFAQKLGAVGASAAIAWGQSAYKGAKGFAGRQTIGRGAAKLDEKYGERLRAFSPTAGGWAVDQFKRVGGDFTKGRKAEVDAAAAMEDPVLQARALSKMSSAKQKQFANSVSLPKLQKLALINPALGATLKGYLSTDQKEKWDEYEKKKQKETDESNRKTQLNAEINNSAAIDPSRAKKLLNLVLPKDIREMSEEGRKGFDETVEALSKLGATFEEATSELAKTNPKLAGYISSGPTKAMLEAQFYTHNTRPAPLPLPETPVEREKRERAERLAKVNVPDNLTME
ncbi:MAG: hypothetical protein HY979_03455 [Candidatus Magasanikbacteria bacterium]|nr:hypothetical protein [Candidatus Magasanikbacteria bacterium]